MAHQTVSNGPTLDSSKPDLKTQEMLQKPSEPGQFRPPIDRTDSRPNFQYRPLFANPQTPPNQLSSGQPIRPNPRSPIYSQPFVQRGPPVGPGGTPTRFVQAPFPQQPRLGFRPQSPFPRPPLLAQRPQIYQQSSVPALSRPKPTLEEPFTRSQTLDSSEFDGRKYEEVTLADQRPPSAASLSRSFSMTTSNPALERKMSADKDPQNVSRQGSTENVCKDTGSRPESRMDKIMENTSKLIIDSEGEGPIANGNEPPSSNIVTDTPFSPKKELLQDDHKKKELDLTLNKSNNKGDNDSGVDESTQGNDQSCNGDSRSPRKPSKSRTSSATPTKGRSVSRGSKTPSTVQSPDSAATTPGSVEKKKVPMNKVQVGAAPSPNLKVVKSKIGSLDNATYKPGGGKVRIESKKLEFKNAGPRIEAKNDKYVPKGGEKKEVQSARSVTSATKEVLSARSAGSGTFRRKILSQKLEWNAKSKIGSLDNANHKPKGGDKKIETVKLNFKEKAAPKVGSKDNIKHQPGGGDIKIENKKIELNATSKVGSLDNMKHKPSGGDKKIFDDKDYLKQQKSGKSSIGQSLSGSQHSVNSQEPKAPVADENLNQEH